MVASISARGSASAALGYYAHLQADDYYTRGGEPPGRWAGDGAERLSLRGPVTQAEFAAALNGVDPKTGERLVQHGGQGREHSAGWDMTFSAPKSVSVLWALSPEQDRPAIEQAHRSAVMAATKHLEQTAAWARRGRAGATREPTAGLLMAQFDHHTSREADPQLHTHTFIFNLAPRRDGTWGAIISRELYKAQKEAGAAYRRELASELERLGYRLDREKDGFRVATIPRDIERQFSKRRQAIEEAARTHGYRSAKGMELATLRTRRAKGSVKLNELFQSWQGEDKAAGFELSRDRQQQLVRPAITAARSPVAETFGRHAATGDRSQNPPPAQTASTTSAVTSLLQAAIQLGAAVQAIERPKMSGLRVKLRDREHEQE